MISRYNNDFHVNYKTLFLVAVNLNEFLRYKTNTIIKSDSSEIIIEILQIASYQGTLSVSLQGNISLQ